MYPNLCRLCAQESVGDDALKLFERRQRTLLTQLKDVTGVLLKNSCGLPKLVCVSCTKSLQKAHKFRENVLKAQVILKTRLLKGDGSKLREEVAIEATEFVQVCYMEDVDPNTAVTRSVDESEINIAETQTSIKKEGTPIDNSVSEINGLEMCSNEANLSQVIESKERPGNVESIDLNTNKSYDNDDGGDVSEEFSETNGVNADCAHKNKNTARSTRKKIRKKVNTADIVAATTNSRKEGKPRKRRINIQEQPNVFICDQCGNHFTCRHHFKLHLRRHTGDKQCACELCPDKFFTSSELRRHMRRHTGERPFACKFCERRFTDYSTRIKHERTHTNERPFMCSQCGKSFTTSYILKNHMLTHTGERHFRCEVCDKAFTRRTHLVVHFRSIMHKQAVEKVSMSNSNYILS